MTITNETVQTETLIDAPILAAKLNVHEVTIRKWQRNGKIPAPVRIGRAVKWRLQEIEAWIKAGCPPRTKWEAMSAAVHKNKR